MSLDPWEPHVRPINELVDALSGALDGASCPYVSPEHGGTDATVLSVLSNPGNGASGAAGSGFLTISNADPTSRVQRQLMAAVGLTAQDITPWNACPWYINDGKPSLPDIYKGVAVAAALRVLPRLLAVLPKLRVVLLQGAEARTAWEAFKCVDGGAAMRYTVVSTVHPLGTRRRDKAARSLAVQQQAEAFAKVAAVSASSRGAASQGRY